DVAAPPVLKRASFELSRGEVLGIAGLMGSGRSELVRALFGLEPRASGRIALHGRQLAVPGATPARRVAQGLGYLSEDRRREGLALALSVADNLTATRISACSAGWGWHDLDRQGVVARGWIDALRIRATAPAQPARAALPRAPDRAVDGGDGAGHGDRRGTRDVVGSGLLHPRNVSPRRPSRVFS